MRNTDENDFDRVLLLYEKNDIPVCKELTKFISVILIKCSVILYELVLVEERYEHRKKDGVELVKLSPPHLKPSFSFSEVINQVW